MGGAQVWRQAHTPISDAGRAGHHASYRQAGRCLWPWVRELLTRRHPNVMVSALENKLARFGIFDLTDGWQ